MIERGAQAVLVHQLLEIAKALKVSAEKLLPEAEAHESGDQQAGDSLGASQLISALEPLHRITR
jgi:hypothetical protein